MIIMIIHRMMIITIIAIMKITSSYRFSLTVMELYGLNHPFSI